MTKAVEPIDADVIKRLIAGHKHHAKLHSNPGLIQFHDCTVNALRYLLQLVTSLNPK